MREEPRNDSAHVNNTTTCSDTYTTVWFPFAIVRCWLDMSCDYLMDECAARFVNTPPKSTLVSHISPHLGYYQSLSTIWTKHTSSIAYKWTKQTFPPCLTPPSPLVHQPELKAEVSQLVIGRLVSSIFVSDGDPCKAMTSLCHENRWQPLIFPYKEVVRILYLILFTYYFIYTCKLKKKKVIINFYDNSPTPY